MRLLPLVLPVILVAWCSPSAADITDDPGVEETMVDLKLPKWAMSRHAWPFDDDSSTHPRPPYVVVDGYQVLAERDDHAFSAMTVFVRSSGGRLVAHWESFNSDIHVLIQGNLLYRTNYFPLVEGLTLAAHDLTSGELLWETKEHGYWNRVVSSDHMNWGARIYWEEGKLVLIGREGDGGYVERIDPKNGQVLERLDLSKEDLHAIDAKAGIDDPPLGNKP